MSKRLMYFSEFLNRLVHDGEGYDEESGQAAIQDYYVADGYFEEGELFYKDDDGNLHEVTHILQEGGGEGGAEHCETVLEIGTGNFVKIVYCYYSHHGYEFDGADVYEVHPTVKQVTVYE